MLDGSSGGPGRVVGGFRLHEVIGHGAMGAVYRATSPDGRPAALKLMLHAGPADPDLVRRFSREASIRIDHPNICRVLAAGTDADGTPYIAFELLRGETLEARLERGTLQPPEAAELGGQVCEGLTAAHAAGVIHRDLKPSNLFLCTDGPVRLFDFGVALWWGTGRETRLTKAGAVVGTPSYLSPEQAQGRGDVDARTDIWSLGVVLYETLCGKPPFERQTALATMVAVVLEEAPPLAAQAPGVPTALAVTVERAIRKLKEERWHSAQAFGEALRDADLVARPAEPTFATPARSIAPGEQRVVAVLLAEGVREAAAIERAVREMGGLFLPLMGLRAIGLFGAEAWEGDEVTRAASAALQARPAAERMAVAAGRATSSGMAISGAALNAAEAGCAARLEGVAADDEAAHALRTSFSLRAARSGVWELSHRRAARRPTPAPEFGPEEATCGRDAELAQMRLAAERVVQGGRALALLVTGPAGIGKSHLRREMVRLLARVAPEGRMLWGRAEPLRRGQAFAPFVSALRGRARAGELTEGWPRLDPGAPAEERWQAVLRLARDAIRDGKETPDWLEPLGELLGVPPPGLATDATATRDPQLLADRLRMALHDYFAALAAAGPVALLVEDLQWADQQTLDLLSDLPERLSDLPLLVFATARPELDRPGHGLFGGADALHIRLQGLPAADVGRLGALVAGRPLAEPLVRAIVERTAGNPLFVREIVLELAERGMLDGAPDRLPLPLTVEAAVQSRLDHLLAAEKDLCKRAAVWSRPFSASEIAALGLSEPGPLLTSLAGKGVVGVLGRARREEARYAFRSTLVADVAYRMLADDLRADLHRRAAACLAGVPHADPEEVAVHHERGGEAEKAAGWYGAAALRAAERGDSAAVVRCAARACEFEASLERRYDLHLAYADALDYLGRREEQQRELTTALGVASGQGQRAWVLIRQVHVLYRLGRAAGAIDAADAAVAAARRAGDPDALAQAHGQRSLALATLGRQAEAREALRDALCHRSETSTRTRAFLENQRGLLAVARGDPAEAREAFRAAAALDREAGDVRRAAGNEANLADSNNRFGAYAEAEAALRAALEGARRVGHRSTEGYALCNLGYALTMLGRTAEAVESLAQAEARAGVLRDGRLALAVRVYRSRALLAAGDLVGAAVEADRAAAEAEPLGAADLRVAALTLAARARLAAGNAAGALTSSAAAIDLRDRLRGIAEDEIEVFLTHADALGASGRAAEAQAVLVRGHERLAQIASRIEDPEWRTRFLRDVPAHRRLIELANPQTSM